MKRRALRRRYGRATEKTKIMVMNRTMSIGDGPGPVRSTLFEGDRVEVGGPAANSDYLIAYRVQPYGEGWRRLGPFAVIPKHALSPRKRRR